MNVQMAWPRCPKAANYIQSLFDAFADANPLIESMAVKMRGYAGVSMIHLIDHWLLPDSPQTRDSLNDAGFIQTRSDDGDPVWSVPHARLPRLRLSDSATLPAMAIAVEKIADFAEAWDLPGVGRRGDTDSGYEEACFSLPAGQLAVIVRLGYSGFRPGELNAGTLRAINAVRNRLRERERLESASESIQNASSLLNEVATEIGESRAVDELFAAEREYYISRNAAARYQYRAQQELGIGWANQDHHTYRSSREGFRALVQLWTDLGFIPRERYYAGEDAGWGAQILEHPMSRVVLFCDVDIAPDELDIDFSSTELSPRNSLGTIGLWCALHGDSIGQAGLHHLECEFDFESARGCLEAAGFGVMPPFTDLSMLKQAFTKGEIWPVNPKRAALLADQGMITEEQRTRFVEHGATGSHLEILQRWEGFKGFNKTGVSAIILATDARR